MTTITQQINFMKKNKQIGIMTHVVAGFPSLAESEEVVLQMAAAGVDMVEIQIPFSDPIADGPTIMKANDHALSQSVTTDDVFALVGRVSGQLRIPLLLMGYYHSVFQYGVEKFCQKASQAGVQGLIIPDLPIDEDEYQVLLDACSKLNMALIKVLSPTSTDERIEQNLLVAQEFVYCTAVSGTTGTREEVAAETKAFLLKMRQMTDLPLAVGFGISKPEHVQSLIGHADIAVIGSAVIQLIEKQGVGKVCRYVRSLVEAGR